MSHVGVTLHRVGDITPPVYALGASNAGKLKISLQFNGGTVVLEHLANEAVSTEVGTWSADATYTTNQVNTLVTGTAGFMYRLRCSVAPTAGKGINAVIDQHGA